jgi:hypothetical protein
MSRPRKAHHTSLTTSLQKYAKGRALEYSRYSPFHMRLMDGGFTVLDVWTTARYYVLTTDYLEMLGKGHVERGGEKGYIPLNPDKQREFLDKLFFPEEGKA